ncbi:MAG TPA: hypothetical protein VMG58_12185 [Candidatus Sulfotelmatobacter sp.]|nr:hypothetical protein [Candidatus Sulfotelmatobacter sp.]
MNSARQGAAPRDGADRIEASGSVALDRQHLSQIAVLTAVAVAGLFYVKWNPYFHRAFVAAAQHSIGPSIVTGKSAAAPAPSVAASLGYAWAYGKAIWQAMVLGLVLGAGVQAVIPRDWLGRLLGRSNFSGVAVAGLASIPSMM